MKLGAGGLVDLEFIVQHALLSLANKSAATPQVPQAISLLSEAGLLDAIEAETLSGAFSLLSSLQQVQRLALTGDIVPETTSAGLKERLARAANIERFDDLSEHLLAVKQSVAELFSARIGSINRPVP